MIRGEEFRYPEEVNLYRNQLVLDYIKFREMEEELEGKILRNELDYVLLTNYLAKIKIWIGDLLPILEGGGKKVESLYLKLKEYEKWLYDMKNEFINRPEEIGKIPYVAYLIRKICHELRLTTI